MEEERAGEDEAVFFFSFSFAARRRRRGFSQICISALAVEPALVSSSEHRADARDDLPG